MQGRVQVVLVGLLAVVAVSIGGVVVALNGSDGGGSVVGPTPTSSAPSTPGPSAGKQLGPPPPASGAWVGAWVKPDDPGAAARVAAFERFESLAGRRLDLAHVFHEWDEPFPDDADRQLAAAGRVLMISWSGTDTRVIASGREDALIRERARAVRDFGQPVLLRWRWEMNRPNLRASVWSGPDYVAAWTHLRRIFQEEGATNAGWVWCPLASAWDAQSPEFYPGDDQVDWLCVDVYPGKDLLSFEQAAGPFLDWAADRPRPVMIGEFGMEEREPGQRAQWLRDTRAFVRRTPQIKALVYFDARRDTKPVFDLTLRSGDALQAFKELAADPWFDVARTS